MTTPHDPLGPDNGLTNHELLSKPVVGIATSPSHVDGDVITTAKRDLQPGEMLDGEGGYTMFDKAPNR